MKLTPKIHQAMNIAAQKHLGQKRKGNGLPYITHPFAVAFILNDYTDDEDVICAGLLHDVLEDVKGYGYAKMENDFGWRISGIVREVSEDKDPDVKSNEKLTWETRKKKYLKHLEKASQEALLVSAADKLHNMISMVELYGEKGSKIWEKFNASAERSLWFYKECFQIIRKQLKNKIVKDLEHAYVGLETVIGDDVLIYETPKKRLTSADIKKEYKEFKKIYKDKGSPEETAKEKEIREHWAFQKYLVRKRLKKT